MICPKVHWEFTYHEPKFKLGAFYSWARSQYCLLQLTTGTAVCLGNQRTRGRLAGEVGFRNPLWKLFQIKEFPHCRQTISPETGTWKTKTLKWQPIKVISCVYRVQDMTSLECSQKFVYRSGWKVFVFPKPFAKFSGFASPYYIYNGNTKSWQPTGKNMKSLFPPPAS